MQSFLAFDHVFGLQWFPPCLCLPCVILFCPSQPVIEDRNELSALQDIPTLQALCVVRVQGISDIVVFEGICHYHRARLEV